MMYRVSAKRSPSRRARRITVLAKDYPAGSFVARHNHHRGQVMYAESGVAHVTTKEGMWIVPPHRALWVPPRMMHEVRIQTDVVARTFYLDRELSAQLGTHCQVLFISTLLHELIMELVLMSSRDNARAALITPLLMAELVRADRTAIHIPCASDSRLTRACNRILEDPSRAEPLEVLAEFCGASSRTLARLFERELQMTFAMWRQHVRLANALSRMASGESVKRAARKAGYRSSSAFTAMFRRALGVAPTHYLRRLDRRDARRPPAPQTTAADGRRRRR